MESLPDYVQFKPSPGTALKDIFIAASDDLLELLEKMLTMDPCKRITAASVSYAAFTLIMIRPLLVLLSYRGPVGTIVSNLIRSHHILMSYMIIGLIVENVLAAKNFSTIGGTILTITSDRMTL